MGRSQPNHPRPWPAQRASAEETDQTEEVANKGIARQHREHAPDEVEGDRVRIQEERRRVFREEEERRRQDRERQCRSRQRREAFGGRSAVSRAASSGHRVRGSG
jgi:hypothetical protein